MNTHFLPAIALLLLLLSSCNNESNLETQLSSLENIPNIEETTREVQKKTSNTSADALHNFLSNFGSGESYQTISKELGKQFIAPALKDALYYKYYGDDAFDYAYGEIVYKNDNFVAVSFEYDGDDGMNMLNAVFVVTYNLEDGSYIDHQLVDENSDFEWYHTKGYNMKVTQSYTVKKMNTKRTAFKVNCTRKAQYYNFNPELAQPMPATTEQLSYTVNAQGLFSD